MTVIWLALGPGRRNLLRYQCGLQIHLLALKIDESARNAFVNGPFSIEFYTVQNKKPPENQ